MGDGAKAQRIKLTLMPDGSPAFSLCDADNRPIITLSLREQAHGIVLCDASGKVRALFSIHGDEPTLTFVDEDAERLFQAP